MEDNLTEQESITPFRPDQPLPNDPIHREVWQRWLQVAKESAVESNLSTYKTAPAITCYLSALTLLLWMEREHKGRQKYTSSSDFLHVSEYSNHFRHYNHVTLEDLATAANLIIASFAFVKPYSNKSWILQTVIGRLLHQKTEIYRPGGGTKTCGSGQNRVYADYLIIYEHEGNVKQSPWSSDRHRKRFKRTQISDEEENNDDEDNIEIPMQWIRRTIPADHQRNKDMAAVTPILDRSESKFSLLTTFDDLVENDTLFLNGDQSHNEEDISMTPRHVTGRSDKSPAGVTFLFSPNDMPLQKNKDKQIFQEAYRKYFYDFERQFESRES